MIVKLPDKNMAIRFPDDMDPEQIKDILYTKVYGQQILKSPPKESFWQKVKNWLTEHFREPNQAESAAATYMSNQALEEGRYIPPHLAVKAVRKLKKEVGIATPKEVMDNVLRAGLLVGVPAGLVANPVGTIVGLSAFGTVDAAVDYAIRHSEKLSFLDPEKYNESGQAVLELFRLIGEGGIAAGIERSLGKVLGKEIAKWFRQKAPEEKGKIAVRVGEEIQQGTSVEEALEKVAKEEQAKERRTREIESEPEIKENLGASKKDPDIEAIEEFIKEYEEQKVKPQPKPELAEPIAPPSPKESMKQELLARGFTEKQIERAKPETLRTILKQNLKPEEVSISPEGELKLIRKKPAEASKAPEQPAETAPVTDIATEASKAELGLQKELADMKRELEQMKVAHKIIRDKRLSEAEKKAKLAEIGLPPEEIERITMPDYMQRVDYQSRVLRRLRNKIKAREIELSQEVSPDPRIRFGELYSDEPVTKPSPAKFLPLDSLVYETDKGSYSNGVWLLKKEVTPKAIQNRIKKAWERIKPDRTPKEEGIWPKATQSKPLEYLFTKKASDPKKDINVAVFKGENGELIALNEHYWTYLNKNIKDMSLRASATNPKRSPVVIYSGDKPVGLIMPMDLGSALEGLKADTLPKAEGWQPIKGYPKKGQYVRVEWGGKVYEGVVTGARPKKLKTGFVGREITTAEGKKVLMPWTSAAQYYVKQKPILAEKSPEKKIATGTKTKAFKGNLEKIVSEQAEGPPKIIKKSEIIKYLSEKLNVPIRRGHFRVRGALGIYKEEPDIIRFKAGDIPVISHEIGHFLEDNYPDLAKLIRRNAELQKLDYEGKKRASEGFGEFLRFYITQPQKASEAAPQFYKTFTEWLDKNPEIKEALHTAREDYQAWLKMPAVMKVKSQISFTPPKEGFSLKRTLNEIHEAVIDDLSPIKRFVDLAKEKGIEVTDDENPYILARLFRGWVGKANHWLEHKTFNTKLEITGKGLKEILEPVKNHLEDFETYLVARRAVELNKKGIRTGISTKDAEAAIKELEAKYPHFPRAAQEIYDYQDRLLDYAQENGLISKELRSKLKQYKNYVPFYRVWEELQQKGYFGKRFANIASPIKKIKGSEREIISPIESIMKNTYVIINAADRNTVARSIIYLAKRHRDLARMVEKIPTPIAKVASIKPEEILDAATIKELGLKGKDLDKVIDIFRPAFYNPKESIITVLNGGKREFYQVDPDLYKALMNLGEEEASMLIKILSIPASWLRAGATTFSPEFLVRNPLRDQFSAYIYSKFGYVPIRDFIRGLFSLVKKDEAYWEWVRSGGMHSMLVSIDRNYFKKNLRELFNQSWKKAVNPVEWMRALSEFGEAATRLGEFKLGRAKGVSPRTAAFSSRNITLDFARKGTKIKTANRIIAFLNANIQGLARPFAAFQEAPARTFWKLITGITLPSIVLYLINRNDKNYQELPRWQKDLFWIIRIPTSSGEVLLRIPKPFELGIIFGSVPERVLEYIDKKDPKALDKLEETILRGINIDVIPTALKPIIENLANYSFFRDRPLESEALKRLLPEYRYYEFTHETARKLGELLGVSPVKIENLIRGYSGALGDLTLDLIDFVITGGKRKLPLTIETTPVIRGLIAREPIGSVSKSVNDFYENYKKLTEAYMTYRFLVKQGKIEEARKILEENPKLGDMYRRFSKAAKILTTQRKLINQILDSDKSKKEKLKEIKEIGLKMRAIAEKINAYYYANRR